METELKGLIERIKNEGVEKAEQEAQGILSKAREEEKNIIEAAKSEKQKIIKNATKEAQRVKENGEKALSQAARDVVLGLKGSIVSLFDEIVKRDIEKVLSKEVLKEMIIKLVDKMEPGKNSSVEILLSEEEKNKLEQFLLDSLSEEVRKGVNFKVSPNIVHGFRIGEKDKNSYYDFTDEAIAEAFIEYLNPKITEIIKGTVNTE